MPHEPEPFTDVVVAAIAEFYNSELGYPFPMPEPGDENPSDAEYARICILKALETAYEAGRTPPS